MITCNSEYSKFNEMMIKKGIGQMECHFFFPHEITAVQSIDNSSLLIRLLEFLFSFNYSSNSKHSPVSKTWTSFFEMLITEFSTFPSNLFNFRETVENGEELSQDRISIDDNLLTEFKKKKRTT